MKNGVQDLADQAQLNFANEALDGLKGGVGVRHPEQSNTGEANVSKDLEISGAPDFIKDDEVGTNEEDDLSRLFEVALERCILRNAVSKLQVSWRLHRLDQRPHLGVKVLGNGLGEGGFARTRAATDKHATMVVTQSVHQALIEVVIAQAEFGHRSYNGDFTGVRKRGPGRGDAKITELNHAATFPVDFQKAIAAMTVLFHQGNEVFLELFKRKGVPIGDGGFCFNEFE